MKKYYKKIIIGIITLLSAITLFVGFKIVINKNFIKNYPDTFNQEYRLLLMSIFNIYEPYVADYNYGNYYYKEERYAEAVEKYKKALNRNVPRGKICDIEINLSLSLMQLALRSETEDAIEYLNEAKTHLKQCINLDLDDIIEKEQEELEKANEENKNEQGLNTDKESGVDGKNKENQIDGDSENDLKGEESKGEGSDSNKEGQGGDGKEENGETPGGEAGKDGKGSNPSGNKGGQGAEGDGNGESGSDGKGDGQGDGGGGNNNNNTGSKNNGSGSSGQGNVDGSGNGNSTGGEGGNAKSNGSNGTAEGGASGQGTNDKANSGNGSGSNNGSVGSYSGKSTEQKQKDAVIMENEVNDEINSLLKQLNSQKAAEDKLNDIKFDEKLDQIREANQQSMNLKEISFEEMMQAQVNKAKSYSQPSKDGKLGPDVPDSIKKNGSASGSSFPTINLNPGSTGVTEKPVRETPVSKPKYGTSNW